MAALNFPTTGLVPNVTEYSANGTTYLWDGVKWVGRTAGGAAGTNSIQNNGNTVQVGTDGKLVLPAYSLPNTTGTIDQVLTWPQSGTVLEWRDNTGLGNFTVDGSTMHIPVLGGGSTSYLNAGGVGTRNSVQLRTVVEYTNTDITQSEIALEAGNGGFSAQVYGHWTGGADGSGGPTLVYAGVENVSGANGPGFAGMVAIDPGVTSPYAVAVDEGGKIYMNVGGPVTTTQYTAALGVLTSDINGETGQANLNGIAVTPDFTAITGKDQITMSTDRGLVLFGNQPEHPTVSSHWHIMPADSSATDLFFGNDTNYVKLPRGTGNVVVGAGGPEWLFDVTGNLTLPSGGDILNSSGASVLGGGTASTGNIRFVTDFIYNRYGITVENASVVPALGATAALTIPANGNTVVPVKLQNNLGNVAIIAGTDIDHLQPWVFDVTGKLTLPPGGDIVNSSGQSVLGAGGNGTANRVQFANAGSITQAQDAEPGRYNIVIDAEKDVVINTDEEGQQFRFTSTGNLKLSRNSIISDKDESLDIVVDRPSQSSYWYNIFGYTGAVIDSNTAINGSVCHDTGGNVYALGSVYGTVSSDNLFMKFSPEGELLWRRTWTDTHGNPCGSYNSSMRFIAANVALGTQDTILWAAFVGWEDHTSYVGTMDTDGNMVDEFGNPRLATRLEGIKVTDVEWAGNVESFNSAVYAVGNYRAPGYNYIPCVYGVDLDTSSVFVDSTVSPAGVNLAFGGIYNDPWTNTFNATVPIPTIPSGLASIGTYFDGDFHHAMVTFLEQGPPASIAIGTANHGEEDIYGEDICCDANGNVYVIVNNVSNNYAVVIKGNAISLSTGSSIWQIVIGTPESPNQFYATSIAYYHNHVYVLGQYRNNATSNVDVVLVKINEYTGIVWQRVIGTPGIEGLAFYGPPGLESTSGIHVKDGLIAIAFTTSDHSVTGLNTITLQYPIDGSVLGTFGDFYINEFNAGHSTMDYSIVELTVGYNSASTTTAVATLNPTVQTVGTGWTSIQWDLDNNRQVYGPQAFKFTADGMFDTAEITHQGEVRITAAVAPDVIELTPSTWAFQNNDGLRFPDGSVQYGAYVEQETALDGGSAVSVYNIVPRPLVADGGGSSSRHGVTDPVYDGSSGNDYVLDGGGA